MISIHLQLIRKMTQEDQLKQMNKLILKVNYISLRADFDDGSCLETEN